MTQQDSKSIRLPKSLQVRAFLESISESVDPPRHLPDPNADGCPDKVETDTAYWYRHYESDRGRWEWISVPKD